MLPEEKQTCFNCGKEGHLAKDWKLPYRRKQGNNGRALTVGDDQEDVVLGVVVSNMPIIVGDFPAGQPGAQARRKAAAKALIGGKAGVQRLKACNDPACNILHKSASICNNNVDDINNITPISQYDMHLPHLAQGEVGDSRRSSSTAALNIELWVTVLYWNRYGAPIISIHINLGFGMAFGMESSGIKSGLM